MTNDEKAKAYEMALEAARKELGVDRKEWEVVEHVLHNIFPELRESEDERIRKWLADYFSSIKGTVWIHRDITCEQILEWLEKQKENQKSADSIPADCASNAKCEDRNLKYGVFPEDVIVVARACEKLEAHGYPELAHALKNVNLYTKQVDYDHEMWKNCEANFEGGKKEVIDHPEKYGLQKEQKPSFGIYWHAIKKGERLPCRAYIWNPDYEKYPDCWEGRLIPNLEKIHVGADTWYLPAKDVRDLPREGVDELPREQKPAEKQDYSGLTDLERAIHRGFLSAGCKKVPVTIINETAKECLAQMKPAWSEEDEKLLNYAISMTDDAQVERFLKSLRPQPKQEWSEEDERRIDAICELLENTSAIHPNYSRRKLIIWLKSLRPSWKHSEDEERLINTSISFLKDFADKVYENAVECIDWLKSKLNGNSDK